MSDEGMEQIVARGPAGEKGAQGEPGKQLSVALRRSLVFLFATGAALALLALLIGFREIGAVKAQARAAAAASAAQHREQVQQGAAVERKLCSTFGGLADLHAPRGNPKTNPSRAALQQLIIRLREVPPDIDCPEATR